MDAVEELAQLIKAAAREGERRVNAALRPFGVTSAQAEVLIVLAAAEPLSLGDLGDLLIAEGGHPSRLVDRMVTAGWVERETVDDDRRRLRLGLTRQGRELAEQVQAAKSQLLDETRTLSAAHDVAALRSLLEAFLGDSAWAETVRRRRRLHSPELSEA